MRAWVGGLLYLPYPHRRTKEMTLGAVSSTGHSVAMYREGQLRLYTRQDRQLQLRLRLSLETVKSLAVNDRWVAVLTAPRRLSVWSTDTNSVYPVWSQAVPEEEGLLAWTDTKLAVGWRSGAVAVYDLQGVRQRWRGITEPITAITWDKSGTLWVGTETGTLWRTRAEASERWVRLSIAEATAMCANDQFVYVASGDSGVYQVETRARTIAQRWFGHPASITALALCQEGVISGDERGMLWRWVAPSPVPREEFVTPLGQVLALSGLDSQQCSVAVSPQGVALLAWRPKQVRWLLQLKPDQS